MQALSELLRIFLPVAYAAAALCYLSLFVRDDDAARRIATPLLLTAVFLHAVFLGLRTLIYSHLPINGPEEVLSLIAFAVALVHLTVEVVYRNQGAGVFIVGFVFGLQTLASASMVPGTVAPELLGILKSPWFAVHSGSAIIGYSGFAVSAVYGVLFLLLYRDMKASRFGLIYERLPSLELLAGMTVRAAASGLLFLTIAIAAGIVWSIRLDYAFFTDPKFIVTVVLWVVYGACLLAHFVLRWHQRRVVYFSLFGFLLMLFSVAAVNVLFRSFHSFSS